MSALSPVAEFRCIGPFTGVLDHAWWTVDLPEKISVWPDLARAAPGGRSGLFRVALPRNGQPIELVVKAFRPGGPFKDVYNRMYGSKAERSWMAAERLRERGVGTPSPVGYLDLWRSGRLRESYYLSEYAPGLTSFRDELIRLYRTDPECARLMALLQAVADAVRALHEAGLFHRDLGNQNILLRRAGADDWTDVQFVDLNRARLRATLTLCERARDISRLTLPSDFLRVFKEMYWRAPPPPAFERAERRFRRAFALHTRTRALRHPLRTLRALRTPAPGASRYPAEPDLWIWDERSGQAISALRAADRRRYLSARDGLLTLAAVGGAIAGGVRARYRALRAAAYGAPVELARRFGVSVHPEPDTFEREADLLDALGPVPARLRLYRHRGPAQWRFAAEAARELTRRGHPVAVALVQDRLSVRDSVAWAAFVEEALDRVDGVAEWVEVGHAANRVKWGVWRLKEYTRLLDPVARAAARRPGLRFMGPAAIDFEYHRLAALLRAVPAGFRFQALSHHLYVDRRGAPENEQAGFDLEGKLALARALAQVSPACEDRLIVSEVNWPLKGTGVYSPVGSPYESPGPRYNDPSVSEQDYADFMVRYLAAAVCSGLAERVYWWRLAARGYGLVDDADPAAWRIRPAYEQLKTLLAFAGLGRFLRRLPAPEGVRLLAMESADQAPMVLAWSCRGARDVRLPFAYERCFDARGAAQPGRAIVRRLDGAPLWLTGVST